MVRTVSRSSVAKWPDIGATISTRGLRPVAPSLRKRSSVPNGVRVHDLLAHRHLALADVHAVDAEGGRWCVSCGQREHLAGGGQLARCGASPAEAPGRSIGGRGCAPVRSGHISIGLGLIGLVHHGLRRGHASYSNLRARRCSLAPWHVRLRWHSRLHSCTPGTRHAGTKPPSLRQGAAAPRGRAAMAEAPR